MGKVIISKIPVVRRNNVVHTHVVVTKRTATQNAVSKPATKIKSTQIKTTTTKSPRPSLARPTIPNRTNSAKPKPHGRTPRVKYTRRGMPAESVSKINAIRNVGTGKCLIIVGNGPSIIEIPLERLRDHQLIHTMSINMPDMRLWPTTYWAFCDPSQLHRHMVLWDAYNGIALVSTAIKRQRTNSIHISNIGGHGFSKDLTKGMHIGRSTVYANMQTALWMNYDEIIIVGCDMHPDGLHGKLHFYGTNPDVDPGKRASRFQAESEFYEKATDVLTESERQRFVFASNYNPWGFPKRYRTLDHTSVVDAILQRWAPQTLL